MLGLPASVKAPALAATGGRAVAQLIAPWLEGELALNPSNVQVDQEDKEQGQVIDISKASNAIHMNMSLQTCIQIQPTTSKDL